MRKPGNYFVKIGGSWYFANMVNIVDNDDDVVGQELQFDTPYVNDGCGVDEVEEWGPMIEVLDGVPRIVSNV